MAEYLVALAGNPNVGKSTLFNHLTGLRQHTGNWPGQTVERSQGVYHEAADSYILTDLPGTYALWGTSPEEEIAGDFLRSRAADVTVVLADAGCLARTLVLALQIRQRTDRMVLCVNLMDEAEKKGIKIDTEKLSRLISAPVAATAARSGRGLSRLKQEVAKMAHTGPGEHHREQESVSVPEKAEDLAAPRWEDWQIRYELPVERALQRLTPHLSRADALELLLGRSEAEEKLKGPLARAWEILRSAGFAEESLRDSAAQSVVHRAEEIERACVHRCGRDPRRDERIDRWLTGGWTAPLAMLALLGMVLYLTVYLANYPSALLSRWLMALRGPLRSAMARFPGWLTGMVVDGMYTTTAWVVAVMLPPMAIFFPLFTLLEDVGYLPRVAFNLDRFFSWAGAHGRQSLTMCMGLGCNACGVTGCRIIDSPRERLIAVLTNSFMPCNGRFPTLIALISLFAAPGKPLLAAALLAGCILASAGMTLLVSRFLSDTALRGESSSFSLELPPYRLPQVGRVLVRSLRDRTAFVLGRAVTVAAPAGAAVWLLANVTAGGVPLMQYAADFLQPIGSAMGLDGMILLAFLLGFPANEIVVPILLMGYLSSGTLTDYGSLAQLGQILAESGWTVLTAASAVILCLWHFPCGTTCLTIWKETGSAKWTLLGLFLPAVCGAGLCLLLRGVAVLAGWV